MSMYERFANDLSEDLFNSVYTDLYNMAMKSNRAAYEAAKKSKIKYSPSETQGILNGFCKGMISLGDAMDYIKLYK